MLDANAHRFRPRQVLASAIVALLVLAGCSSPQGGSGGDTTAPRVVSAASGGSTVVTVVFDEAMGSGATDPTSYAISPSLAVTDVSLDGGDTTATLTTAPQSAIPYTVTVSGAADTAGNAIDPANASASFTGSTTIAPANCGINTPSATDSDGDGLTDAVETAGWTINVEDGRGVLSSRAVTSDPLDPDTDGDGVCDPAEQSNVTDPRSSDTDQDGLGDFDELNIWASSPTDVDTDDDSDGNSALFDGQEVTTQGTSPTLADTDGDGISDGDEVLQLGAIFDPLLANVPIVETDLVGNIDLGVNVVLTSNTSDVNSYQSTLEQGQSSEYSTTDTTAHEVSAELSVAVGTEVTASFPPGASVSTSVDVTATAGYSFNTSNSVSEASAQESREAYTEAVENSRSEGRELQDGTVAVNLVIRNPSTVAYRLESLVITALQRDRENPASFKSIASLTFAGFTAVSLAPGDETGILRAEADIPANVALELMAEPERLFFEIGSFQIFRQAPELFRDIDFAFLEQETNAKTALLQIDYGNGNVIRERIATNVARSGGQIVGVTMRTILEDVLGLDYATTQQTVDGAPGRRVLTRLHDAASGSDVETDAASNAFWALVGANGVAITEDTDFEDVVLEAGDAVYLLYVRDEDGDGLFAREEYLYNTFDSQAAAGANGVADPTDSDGDGISDGDEVKVGWSVGRAGTALVPPYDTGARVYPDPSSADADRDGLSDPEERTAGTDPNNPDTDGDLFCDGGGSGGTAFTCQPTPDPDPLDPTITGNQPPTVGTLATTVNGFQVALAIPVGDPNGIGDIDAIDVEWGDGSFTQITSGITASVQANHAYLSTGVYDIDVIVTDSFGRTATASTSIEIAASSAALLGEYLFNDAAAADTSGSGNDGTVQNTACTTPVTDRFGLANNAYAFSDNNAPGNQAGGACGVDGVGLITAPNLGFSDSFTFTAWITPINNNNYWIVGQAGSTFGSQWAQLYLGEDSTGVNPSGDLGFTIPGPTPLRVGSSGSVTGSIDYNNPTTGWTFVAVTVAWNGDAVTPSTTATLFRANEGEPLTSVGSNTVAARYQNPSATNPLTIGNASTDDDGSGFMAFEGRIDDVRVYDRALSQSELEVLATLGAP